MKKAIFTGVGTAIATPMNKDGGINYEEFGKMLDFQVNNGADAVIVCGTTGESATMTDDEHIECIRFAVKRISKKIPVIAGTGSNDTIYAAELSKEAEKIGADALLLVTPYYNKTSQRGLIGHFTKIADGVNIPIVLYNVPSRTGVNISIDTYKELSKHERINAVKEAGSNSSLMLQITAYTDLVLYSGNDDETLPALSVGGRGVISVSSNLCPKEKHDEVALYINGEREKALEIQKKLLPLEKALFMDVNPIPVKEALNIMGFKAGECRLPLCRASEETIGTLRRIMEPLGLVDSIK